MNNLKKITVAAVAALSLATSVFASTAENDIMLISQNPDTTNAPKAHIISTVEIIDDVAMLPLRSNAEHFGFSVEWNAEDCSVAVAKGAIYTTFRIDANEYSFSKMAPMALEMAPVLVNDETTYVPVSFFTEILNLNAQETQDGYKLAEPRIVTVLDVQDGSILVSDDYFGEVIVLVSEDTAIVANGEAVEYDLIEKDQMLSVEYNDMMTRSIPPQTTALNIEILNLAYTEPLENTSVVKVLSVNEEGSITVEDDIHGELIVWIADETVITKDNLSKTIADIEKDDTLEIVYSDAMTMSIPPQTTAISIVIK